MFEKLTDFEEISQKTERIEFKDRKRNEEYHQLCKEEVNPKIDDLSKDYNKMLKKAEDIHLT